MTTGELLFMYPNLFDPHLPQKLHQWLIDDLTYEEVRAKFQPNEWPYLDNLMIEWVQTLKLMKNPQ